ncbi:MAG: hypothetical protein WBC22_19250 [Sedimentisphaerales bacterium]
MAGKNRVFLCGLIKLAVILSQSKSHSSVGRTDGVSREYVDFIRSAIIFHIKNEAEAVVFFSRFSHIARLKFGD